MTRIDLFFELLFIISAGLIFYSYVIFPALMGFLARGKTDKPIVNNDFFPGVTIIISVFNEEKVIAEKIESIMKSIYPADKIEIIIGSDASTDRTVEIISSIKDSGIRLFDFKNRRGKGSVINELVSRATHDIIILTDANVFFEKTLVRELTKHFSFPQTGLVGANILNIGLRRDGISVQEKSYIQRENLIKYREGILWGCMMGPFGACYALRKELYTSVPAEFLVDDFYLSMKIIEKKYDVVNELSAICYEDVSNDVWQEYRRKVRISTGNFQNLKEFFHFVLKPFTAAGFCFVSHKVLRWITPFFILITLISLSWMAQNDFFFAIMLAGEVLLILSPFIDWLFRKLGFHWKVLRFVSYFSMMNLALLKGFFRFLKGVKSGTWQPTKRAPSD